MRNMTTTSTLLILLIISILNCANADIAKIDLKAVTARDISCLINNTYFEANGENSLGWDAINFVVVNRMQHHSFPKTVCGVIEQKAQFSWLWDGRKNQIKDKKTYTAVKKSVFKFIAAYNHGGLKDITHGAIFYNNPKISKSKRFFRRLTVVYRNGNHVFYTHNMV